MAELLAIIAKVPSSLVIAVSALIAWRAIGANRKLARQKNTLDFETNHLSVSLAPHYSVLGDVYRDRLEIPVAHWAKDENFDTPQGRSIREILNTWERVAKGIEHGIYDETILYETYRTTILKIALYTLDYRRETQRLVPTYYTAFDDLALRWRLRSQDLPQVTPRDRRRIRALRRLLDAQISG